MIDSFEQGGSERQALQLVRQLHESGRCRVRLACLNNRGVCATKPSVSASGRFPSIRSTVSMIANFVTQLRRCARFLKENEIDVVHTHDFYTNIFGMTAAATGWRARENRVQGRDGWVSQLTAEAPERGAFRSGASRRC